MSDDDLIRRGDAKAACQTVADEAKSYRILQMTMGANTCRDAINDLPADFRTDIADALAAAASPLMDMAMWTESAEDTEMVIVSVGTVRRIRSALAAWEARK